jgi:hypothetical protein
MTGEDGELGFHTIPQIECLKEVSLDGLTEGVLRFGSHWAVHTARSVCPPLRTSNSSLVCRYRGGLYIDGGVLRHIPAPPRVAFSAGISCVPLKVSEHQGVEHSPG